MYYGVSIVQDVRRVRRVFALAQLALPTGVANGIAVRARARSISL